MYTSVDDSVLVSSYISGDQKALEILLHRYKNPIFKKILTKVRSHELAEDIFQDTFIKIIHTLLSGKYNEEGKFLPWALRIANNLVIDYFRKNNARKMISEASSSSDSFNVFTHMSNDEDNWLEYIMRSELHNQLLNSIDFLPDLQQEVVRMRIFEDLSFKEIAEKKNISINTALGRMRYAIQNLRKLLDEKGVVMEYA
jgi:RNA polymerase sigma-70 factor (ECF subfamily)